MSIRLRTTAAALAVALASSATAARASDQVATTLPKGLEGVSFEQKLGVQVPLDLSFRDETGRERALREFVSTGRPVILTLNYLECPMLCTVELNGLVSALKPLNLTPGKDFDIVTVSFNPAEGPELAAEKKAKYLESYGRPEAAEGWHFLTGSAESIATLTDAVGFHYRYDEAEKQFSHAAGIIVLTPDGKASRYFFGVEFAPRDVRLALVESSQGKIGTLADKVMLFCFHYDPAESKYGLAALNVIRAGGAATVVGLLAFVVLGNRVGSRRGVHEPSREVTHGV
ncbi:MAG: SCO family protein [Deltaproteobacteria bacterium]|nr:SCO family protein [Deltaproteobacteria bacterium]